MTGDFFVSLSKPLSPQANSQIDLFCRRFHELWANWGSLKQHGIRLGGSFSNNGDGSISGPGCNIEIHRLKGFYLDFRFFWAKREPTEYFKVASLLSMHCQDGRLRKCLTANKTQWIEAGTLQDWHGVRADEMINVLFNGQIFHSDLESQTRLAEINAAMGHELAHHLLTFSIYNRMLVVRNLNWIMEPICSKENRIRLPSEYA